MVLVMDLLFYSFGFHNYLFVHRSSASGMLLFGCLLRVVLTGQCSGF